MSINEPCKCDHNIDKKECIRQYQRIVYGKCSSCQTKVCLEHLSEHHKIEIEPYFDILIDHANQIREKLMSIDSTKQCAQQIVEIWKREFFWFLF